MITTVNLTNSDYSVTVSIDTDMEMVEADATEIQLGGLTQDDVLDRCTRRALKAYRKLAAVTYVLTNVEAGE